MPPAAQPGPRGRTPARLRRRPSGPGGPRPVPGAAACPPSGAGRPARGGARLSALLLLAGLLALLLPPGPPASARTPAEEPRQLVFSCNEAGWPPYLIVGPDQTCNGIMADILREAARGLGVSVTTRTFPEKRNLLMLRQGEVDVYCKAPEWVAEPEALLWSAPVLPSRDVLVAPADGPPVEGPEDLVGLRLGTVLGYAYPALDAALESGRITRDDAPGTVSQLRKLLRGRTDAAVVNELVARWVLRGLREPGADALRFSGREVGLAWLRYAFTRARDWEPLVARLDAEIARMRADGRIQAILDAYR